MKKRKNMNDDLLPEMEILLKRMLNHIRRKDPYNRQQVLQECDDFYMPKPYGTKKTYPRNWPVIYETGLKEKRMMQKILLAAVEDLNIPLARKDMGRPGAEMKDLIKAECIRSYCCRSGWRIEDELLEAYRKGIIDNVYRKSTLNKYLGQKTMTNWLHKLYQKIAEPLAQLEEKLAVDATGMAITYGKRRWVEVRMEHQLHRDYKKLHTICGAKSKIIFAAEVTKGTQHDSPIFKGLFDTTTKYVTAKELSADPAYLSKFNVSYIASKGLMPFILPKKNTRIKNSGSPEWGAMLRFWKEHRNLFLRHYHKRSNVESCYTMIKKRFGDYTRAKDDIAQINEILCKNVCHNAVVLTRTMLELNITPKFMQDS